MPQVIESGVAYLALKAAHKLYGKAPDTLPSAEFERVQMMAQQQQPAQKPCKGMTLACIAAMGCTVPMAVRNDTPALLAPAANATLAFWTTTTVLHGSELTPEPEPPTLLG